MFPPATKPNINPYGLHDVCDLKQPSALKAVIIESKKNKLTCEIQNVMNYILDGVEEILEKERWEACVRNCFVSFINHPIYSKTYSMAPDVKDFYVKSIMMSKEEIINLSWDTIKQSKCDKWFKERRSRISASSKAHNIKVRKTKTVESLVMDMLHPKNFSAASTQYGIRNESQAKQEYQRQFNCNVEAVGVIVSESQPWLCASVDGVVVKDGCAYKLVEFKCPSTCEKKPIVDLNEKKCNVNYLHFQGTRVELKMSSQYYTQCQVQMYVCGFTVCDLFVYTPIENSSYCVEVHRNETFLKETIGKCEQFYFQHYLPALYATTFKDKSDQNVSEIKIQQGEKRTFTGQNIGNKM